MSVEKEELSPTLRSVTRGHAPVICPDCGSSVDECLQNDGSVNLYCDRCNWTGKENAVCMSIGNGQTNSAMCPNVECSNTPNCRHDHEVILCFQQNERQEVRLMQTDGQIAGSVQANEGEHQRNYLCFDARGNGDGSVAPTNTGDHQDRITDYTALCVPVNSMVIGKELKDGDRQTTGIGNDGDPCPTLQTEHHHAAATNATVRRLMPIETERLMGFPDGWTAIPWKGKPAAECPDSPRYKACGNSMCVNVMRWIGMRIEILERKLKNA